MWKEQQIVLEPLPPQPSLPPSPSFPSSQALTMSKFKQASKEQDVMFALVTKQTSTEDKGVEEALPP